MNQLVQQVQAREREQSLLNELQTAQQALLRFEQQHHHIQTQAEQAKLTADKLEFAWHTQRAAELARTHTK